ncbi:MAG: hypothetical protein Q4P78_06340 [Rothia sp. (in: high G+C Gram-positive bacteria)]|uniref:hypothetical protein n=1 Tax=Rothia sp. (in: high G+C Gram-positive bacteria) TaxID=1885016 RepID=UPI0026E094F5|nr:hypothetical protein [Rothia sp. (in: high G+C Gram-positive bacteria)]MDO5750808.1 hypothetical protein [Rothia sp. (in: high G+C Gram-positive bacteria)]
MSHAPQATSTRETPQAGEKASRALSFTTRIARPSVLITLVIITVLSLALAVFWGTRYSATGPDPKSQAQVVIPVWAQAEERAVSDALAVAGTTKAGETAPIITRTQGEALLVHQAQAPGNILTPGDFLGFVGADPVFVLNGPLPLYRDMAAGDNGDDVLAFQKSLNNAGYSVPESGTVDDATLNALTRLYRKHLTNIPADGIDHVARSNFAVLPAGSHKITAVASVGALVNEGNPIATVETSETFAEATVELSQANKLSVGQRVTLKSSVGTVPGSIASIGALQNDGSKGAVKTIRISADDSTKLVPGQSVSVSGEGDTTKVLAVPMTALRQEAGASYVLIEKNGSSTARPNSKDPGAKPDSERVDVQVLRTANGYAAISGNITPGTKVLLS